MDAGGLRAAAVNTPREFTSIFATNPIPCSMPGFVAGRQRFGKVRMLNRADGVKPSSMPAQGGLLYLLPDMDYGPSDSVFCRWTVPDAATIPSLSRFCPPGQSQVIALVQPRPPGLYGRTDPAWTTTDDHVADTFPHEPRAVQTAIRTMPAPVLLGTQAL